MRGWTVAALLTLAIGACVTTPTSDNEQVASKATATLKASFKANGQAGLDRLNQDETQRVCSEFAGKALPSDMAQKIEQLNLATIKYPADGKLTGDWKNGEKIAQEGRGMQYSDDPKGPTGANCYACHQLAPQELSYGTIGPSLYQFGKQRGYTEEMRKYAYGKIYNPEAYTACTNMPRFGHMKLLNQDQLRHVMALLLDPKSPVNQ